MSMKKFWVASSLLVCVSFMQLCLPLVAWADTELPATSSGSVVVTGEASAGADLKVSINQVEIATQAAKIEIRNEAWVDLEASASAVSGQNIASVSGLTDVTIQTGEARALITVENKLNLTSLDSDYRIITLNVDESQVSNINLVELWQTLSTPKISKETSADISVVNTATSSVKISAVAISGENQAISDSGNATISTGSTFAQVNLLNLINANLIASRVLFTVINILSPFGGDIIVPNLARFQENLAMSRSTNVITQNTSLSQGERLSVVADSGSNFQSSLDGALDTDTGEAIAQASTTSFHNADLVNEAWYQTQVNDYSVREGEGLFDDNHRNLNLTNHSDTNYEIQVLAKSGGNSTQTTQGEGQIRTGQAVALAQVFELINTNLIGSKVFSSIINVFSQWSGKLIMEALEEQDLENNLDITQEEISTPAPPIQAESDEIVGTPFLTVASTHNSPTFVYPKDTLTFRVELENSGTSQAEDVVLNQVILDTAGRKLGVVNLPLGSLPSGAKSTISFGLTIPNHAEPQVYSSQIMVLATSPQDGEAVSSNISTTTFYVRRQNLRATQKAPQVAEAITTETRSGKVQGVMTQNPSLLSKQGRESRPIALGGLLLLLAFLYVIRLIKKKTRLESDAQSDTMPRNTKNISKRLG